MSRLFVIPSQCVRVLVGDRLGKNGQGALHACFWHSFRMLFAYLGDLLTDGDAARRSAAESRASASLTPASSDPRRTGGLACATRVCQYGYERSAKLLFLKDRLYTEQESHRFRQIRRRGLPSQSCKNCQSQSGLRLARGWVKLRRIGTYLVQDLRCATRNRRSQTSISVMGYGRTCLAAAVRFWYKVSVQSVMQSAR